MDITALAETFTTFLLECTSKSRSQKGSFDYELKIGERNVAISATLLPPLVRSPFSEITGPLPCPTVVLGSPHHQQDREKEEDESPELRPILDQFSNSFLVEDSRRERKEGRKEVGRNKQDSVQVSEKRAIFLGSKLFRKRVYLKQEIPFHPEESQSVVRQANLGGLAPLSLDLARAFASYYLVGSRLQESGTLPALWVPCTHTEGAVQEDIVGLGCTHEPERRRVYCVRERGAGEAGAKRDGMKITPGDLQGNAFARYAITSFEICSTGCEAGMMVEFSWDNPETFLSPPPVFGTEGVLHIAVEPGNLQATISTFSELQTLVGVCEAVCDGREWWGDFPEEEGEEVLTKREEPLLINRVDDFLEAIDSPLSHTLQVNVVSPSLENTVFQQRENLDFTENLWLFLKDVRSPEDLEATLGAIFKAFLLGRVRNVTFRETSRSPLAKLLRELLSCNSDAEWQVLAPKFQLLLLPSRLLQTLAQIGVDKLRLDLRVFLIAAKVTSEAEIASFLGDGENLLHQCHSLCNLFHVVELVGTAINYHCLPPPSLMALAKSAMDFYRRRLPFVGFEATPLFSVALPQSSTVLRPVIDMCVGSGTLGLWSVTSKAGDRMIMMRAGGIAGGNQKRHVYQVTCNEV